MTTPSFWLTASPNALTAEPHRPVVEESLRALMRWGPNAEAMGITGRPRERSRMPECRTLSRFCNSNPVNITLFPRRRAYDMGMEVR